MLDTSTVILLGQLAALSGGPHVTHDDAERGARQQHLQQAEADFDVLPFETGSPPYSIPPYGTAPTTMTATSMALTLPTSTSAQTFTSLARA